MIPVEIPSIVPSLINIDFEQSVLGALLMNNKVYDRVVDAGLEAGHFSEPLHGKLFGLIQRRLEAGRPVSIDLLSGSISQDDLREIGDENYLRKLPGQVISVNDTGEYARHLRNLSLRRSLIEASLENVNDARTLSYEDDATDQLFARSDRRIADISESGGTDVSFSAADAVAAAVAEAETIAAGKTGRAISTGMPVLDKLILGLRPSHLITIGGRPGMGKTALARSITLNATAGIRCGFNGERIDDPSSGELGAYFSMEEDETEFGAALLAQLAGVPLDTILSGGWVNSKAHAIADVIVQAQRRLAETPLEIVREPAMTLARIRAACRRIERKCKRKLKLIVVDYLQLMAPPPGARDIRIATTLNIQGLKNLAKEFRAAVIALSQLGRSVDEREDHRPILRDLMESGGIEAASDVVVFPYREYVYFAQKRPQEDVGGSPDKYQSDLAEWQIKLDQLENRAELLIPKVRRGKAPVRMDLRFDGARTRFTEREAVF